MIRTTPIGFAALTLIAGCCVSKIEERPAEGPAGELELRVLRRADSSDLKGGYSFYITRGTAIVGSYVSSSGQPTLLTGLDPGHYRVGVTGSRIDGARIDVKVRAGRKTTLLLLHYNGRRNEKMEEAACAVGDILAEAGRAVGVALVEVGKFVCVGLCEGSLAVLFGDDDDDEDARRPPVDCPPRDDPPRKKEPRRFSAYKKP